MRVFHAGIYEKLMDVSSRSFVTKHIDEKQFPCSDRLRDRFGGRRSEMKCEARVLSRLPGGQWTFHVTTARI
jgi:hypothetical protein